MVKRKPKDPSQSDAVSTTSGVFSTLFGNATEQSSGTAASLFSDNNPFRRKPPQPSLVSDATNQIQSPINGGPANHNSGEEKKRKRKKEKSPALDSDSVIEAAEKKRKPGSDERVGEGKDPNLDGQAIVKGEEGEGKKKRKREVLEKEWEEKKFGTVEGGEEDEGFRKKTVGTKRKVLDNPADMLVTKEGFDDEDKLLRTIFVGNLPLKMKQKALMNEFKKFGEVESVRFRSVPIQDTKKPRRGAILSKKINDSADSVNAYVVFKDEQAAQASLAHNMTVVEGNHIRVDRACPPRKKLKKSESATPLYDHKRTVFVGNLPLDVKDEELYQLFCGMSNIDSSVEAVRVVRDPQHSLGKGVAFVLFKTREAATFVAKKRNLKLRDRQLRLSHAKADATPSKRLNTPSKRPDTPSRRPDTPSRRPNSSQAQAPSTPAKNPVASRSPSSRITINKPNKKPSYQGVRATKPTANKPKERMVKRPSVAARKAKTNFVKEDGPAKQAGSKRKLDSRTPDSSLRSKKALKKNS